MILIGIDPGTATTGFGVIEKQGDRLRFVDCGTFETPPDLDAPARLKMIYEDFNTLLDRYQPAGVATERLFFTNNVTTGIPVGRALGVILLTLAQRGLSETWAEYTPTQVKMATVGTGRADKKQMQFMVTRLLGLNATPKPDDAADALAIALCHAHSLGRVPLPDAPAAASPARPPVRRGVRG